MTSRDLLTASETAKAIAEAGARRVFRESIADFVPVPSRETIDRAIERREAFENMLSAYSADAECEHGNVPGTTPPRCECFKPQQLPRRTPAAVAVDAGVGETRSVQTLTCRTCEREWTRPAVGGRPPHRCPDCRGRAS